jgi:predicted Zn-dependent protease
VAYREAGRLEQALGAAREALRLEAERTDLWVTLAQACLAAGRTEEAVEALDGLLQRAPDQELARQAQDKLVQLRAGSP